MKTVDLKEARNVAGCYLERRRAAEAAQRAAHSTARASDEALQAMRRVLNDAALTQDQADAMAQIIVASQRANRAHA